MSELEFVVLDELYFIISFEALSKNLVCADKELIHCLQGLLDKGWIKLMETVENGQLPPVAFNIAQDPLLYHYLATKDGLIAHHSN